MKYALFLSIALSSILLSQSAEAQTPRQDAAELKSAVENFLRMQTSDLTGKVNVVVGQIDSRLNVTACPAIDPFLPTGSRAWGKTTVGVRCLAPTPWTIYIQANVSVVADYYVAAISLPQGQIIGAAQLKKMNGDLTTLPASVVTDAAQALGRTTFAAVPAGAPLRADTLRSQTAVQQGQIVRLVSIGPGFKISTDARAMGNANDGQVVQVKTLTGQQISGIAKIGGQVEVSY